MMLEQDSVETAHAAVQTMKVRALGTGDRYYILYAKKGEADPVRAEL